MVKLSVSLSPADSVQWQVSVSYGNYWQYGIFGNAQGHFGIAGTNYVGYGYSSGQLGGKSIDPSVPPTNKVDEVAFKHDTAYERIQNDSPTPKQDYLKADIQFLGDILGVLAKGALSPWETVLAKASFSAIAIKTCLSSLPEAITERATQAHDQVEIVGSQDIV